MRSSFHITDDILVFKAYGELDHYTAGKLRGDIDEAMEAFGCLNLIFDMSGVTFMDSSGIGIVLGRYNRLARRGGQVYLAGCSEYIGKILQMAGVFSVAGRADSVEECLAVLKGQEQLRMEV